ncbi:O-antigen/teichoic acid export membrane protein [Natrinema hispanicum]|uniref:O-antigen/teichoic acid export membrane protein n=1 Tax=Natrinema hispanicum TaxID=392421 RepID=A0A482YBW3_9EURY|nr:flippase [Natrinema hispanicum]RZV10898.1 O-antigen/teichoic acid export membrane protein [Natrinema hispanicum]
MRLASKLADQFKAEFSGRVIATISSSILTVLLARLLEPDSYGLLFLAISIYGIVKLFSKLGIARSASRYLAEYRETDADQIPYILKTSFLLNALTILLTGFVLFIGKEHIAELIGRPELSPFLALGALFIGFSSLLSYVRFILQGFERVELSSTVHAADRTCRLFLAVGFVLLGYDVIGALLGYIISAALVSTGGLLFIYISFYRGFEKNPREPDLRRRIIKYAIPLTATNTATVLDKRIDMVLIGFFLNPSAVAFYTAGRQIVQFIKMPMASLGFTLSPMYGSQKANGDSDTAARIYETSLSYGLLLYIPISAGVILIAEPLIELVFGSEYLGAVPILHVFSLYIVLESVTELTNTSLDYLGRARSRAIIQLITAVLNVLLNIILIPLIGIVGAAIATVITHSLYTLANVYIINLELSLRFGFILRNLLYSIGIAIAISIPVYGILNFSLGVISLFISIFLGGLIWILLIQILGLVNVRKVVSTLT